MKIIGCQFDKHVGPDATNTHKISFAVDESQQESMYDFIRKVKKGTEVLLLVYVTGEDDHEINDLVTETEDETRTRLNKRMHAIINNIATNQHKTPAEIKNVLKKHLIAKKCIVKSSAELDIRGLAIAIYYLENEFIR